MYGAETGLNRGETWYTLLGIHSTSYQYASGENIHVYFSHYKNILKELDVVFSTTKVSYK